MKLRSTAILLLAAGLAVPASLSAQPGYMRKGYSGDAAKSEKKSTRRRRRKKEEPAAAAADHGAPAKSGTDKASIEAYLQSRLTDLKKNNMEQGVFGRQMKLSWDKFWTQVYEDRKQFEIRLAKQRLNLFESLRSLDPSFHARTISDFERLQDTQIKSFEADLKSKMKAYVSTLIKDLGVFGDEQERERAALEKAANDAWNLQKAETLSRK